MDYVHLIFWSSVMLGNIEVCYLEEWNLLDLLYIAPTPV